MRLTNDLMLVCVCFAAASVLATPGDPGDGATRPERVSEKQRIPSPQAQEDVIAYLLSSGRPKWSGCSGTSGAPPLARQVSVFHEQIFMLGSCSPDLYLAQFDRCGPRRQFRCRLLISTGSWAQAKPLTLSAGTTD